MYQDLSPASPSSLFQSGYLLPQSHHTYNKHRVPVGSGSYTDLGGSDVCLALGVCWLDFLSNKPLSFDAVVPVVMLQVGGRESWQAKQMNSFLSSTVGSQMASLYSLFPLQTPRSQLFYAFSTQHQICPSTSTGQSAPLDISFLPVGSLFQLTWENGYFYTRQTRAFKKHYWSTVALQRCVSFCCTVKYISYVYNRFPPSWTSLPPHPLSHHTRSSQSTKLSSLCHTTVSHQASILDMVV